MKKTFIKTKNVKRFVALMDELQKLPPNIPKLALVYGGHGLGKTNTIIWWATRNDAVYVRANNEMTQGALMREILEVSRLVNFIPYAPRLYQALNPAVAVGSLSPNGPKVHQADVCIVALYPVMRILPYGALFHEHQWITLPFALYEGLDHFVQVDGLVELLEHGSTGVVNDCL